MKNLAMIIHVNLKRALADLLRDLESVEGFTFSLVEGHGAQSETDPLLSARDKVVGYTPHVRLDILLEDVDVETVLAAIRADGRGISGQGIYWVTPVEEHGRI
jgi:nitrogen regulatory protein P-II 1